MRSLKLLLSVALLCLSTGASARQRVQGDCSQGGHVVTTMGTPSTTQVLQSYPACLVTVYATGTTNLSTLYTNNTGTSLGNPFTADSTGHWYFYADNGRYDINFSGGAISSPFTYGDFLVCDLAQTSPSCGIQAFPAAGPNPWADPTAYGGVHDALSNTTGVTVSGNSTITISGSPFFASTDVGKIISVNQGADPPLLGTITSFISTTQVGINLNATQSLSSRTVIWGTDNSTAITNAIASLGTRGGTVFLPPGLYAYRTSITLPNAIPITLEGASGTSSYLYYIGSNDAVKVQGGIYAGFLSDVVSNLAIDGTGALAGASGIHQTTTVGALYDDLLVANFNRTGSSGMWLENVNGFFNERTSFRKLSIYSNTKGIRFSNTSGTSSFVYTRMSEVHFQIPTSGIALSVEGPSVVIANSEVKFFFNGPGASGTAISVTGGASLGNNFYDVTGEGIATFIAIDGTSSMTGTGYLFANGAPNSITGTFKFTGASLQFMDGVFGIQSNNSLYAIPGSFGETSVTLNSGQNDNVNPGSASFIVISGPGSTYSISGFSGGVSGRRLVVRMPHAPAGPEVIKNLTGSSAGNQINTGTGADVSLPNNSDSNLTEFIYDGFNSQWFLLSAR